MDSIKIFRLVQVLFVVVLMNNTVGAQEASSLEDTIYSVVTIHLTPKRPLAGEIYSKNLLRKISLALMKDIEGEKSLSPVKKDSVIIKLISDLSWELTGQAPKTPSFFLLRLMVNKKNDKVKQRLEYLRFNSLCEQKPSSVYLIIDWIEVYRSYNNVAYKYKFSIGVDNNLTIQERISL